ncbi:DUF115 domain-containing protein [Sporolactobacillus sp. CPB3-1]|uniref:DUF115 domain-containing protein n=1 Tax=Sporolactobacillus mangiferae TaxID=2940498 RepID=A0ABT0MBN6_9BACL|nr:6-hydroxymethylpterin diphosphokinase MptE-like protein [Sporolactobacillus mangiferae]MCL1632282.1 DUF115 domain-containing protein [Sporolactobacillus mangiferae]
MLIDNKNYLRFRNRKLLQIMNQHEALFHNNDDCVVETSKSGSPTLKRRDKSGNYIYVHSRYNPEREAAVLVSRLDEMDQYDHVIFIGIGLGYAVQTLAAEYPQLKISVFEPDLQVLNAFLSTQRLGEFCPDQLDSLIVDEQQLGILFEQIVDKRERCYFFVLPYYEKQYREQIDTWMSRLKTMLFNTKVQVVARNFFQRTVIINAMHNLPKVLTTPNIFQDTDSAAFEGKTAILVSAGPSLNEEFDNLRRIKKKGLAYIFSVGSSINALINHDIYPDAFWSYDASEKNQIVNQIVKDKGITSIPMIFGDCIGYGAIENYPGPLLHMILKQNPLSHELLSRLDGRPVLGVNDAASIAIVTLQALMQLKFRTIILVGQNLGYRDHHMYASGISYDHMKEKLSDAEIPDKRMVASVDGGQIVSNAGFDLMRQQFERYIQMNPHVQVINTTKGGAAIKGADFVPLDRVIATQLDKQTVAPDWIKGNPNYDIDKVSIKLAKLAAHADELKRMVGQLERLLDKLDEAAHHSSDNQIRKKFDQLDRLMHSIERNKYYLAVISTMIGGAIDYIKKTNGELIKSEDVRAKAETIVREYPKLVNALNGSMERIAPSFESLPEAIKNL